MGTGTAMVITNVISVVFTNRATTAEATTLKAIVIAILVDGMISGAATAKDGVAGITVGEAGIIVVMDTAGIEEVIGDKRSRQ